MSEGGHKPLRGPKKSPFPPRNAPPVSPTWCLAGREPPRLYQVTVACPCPATMQWRSKVCPSATEEDEDSMRSGGVTPMAGDSNGGSPHGPWHGPTVPHPLWSPLTVGAGPTGLDCHHDGDLLGGGTAGHAAHVLTRVGRCHLQQPQPGARHLRGGDTVVTRATLACTGPSGLAWSHLGFHGVTRTCMGHLGFHGATWSYMGPLGLAQSHGSTPTTLPRDIPLGVPYLVLGREGPPTLVPGDSGLCGAGDDAVEVQGLALSHG